MRSPDCVTSGRCASSSASTSKSSSPSDPSSGGGASDSAMSALISGMSKPVSSTSKPGSSTSSSSNSANFRESQSPEILFSAMFRAFSFTGGRSTTLTSTSVSPRASRTLKRWWPPTRLPLRLFQTNGSTQPKVSIERLSFSYSGFPGLRSLRGL